MADKLTFHSMKGNIAISGIIDGNKPGEFLLSCSADIDKVDIKDLFYQFDNFGQEDLTDKNVKGELSADEVLFSMRFDPGFKIDKNSIFAMTDLTISKGELNDYAPMQSLSKFLKVDDLSHIIFSNLTNTIEIKDQQIHIPEMNIKSNAFDIMASGIHGFDNHINYKIKILLSELLAKKAKAAKKENEEFGVIEDDGLGRTSLYISITGTVDEPVFKYDKKRVKEKIVTEFHNEKNNFKKALNKEFGWFKKDSAVVNDTVKKKEKKLIIEWDEDK